MKTLLLWIFLSAIIFSQQRSNPIYWEINSLPGDSSSVVYFSFRISYDKLVFTKQNEKYHSGVKAYLEIFKDEEVVSRNSGAANAVLDDYSLTNSPKLYLQGLISLNLPPGKYKLLPELEFLNTERIVSLPPGEIELNICDSLKAMTPICLQDGKDNPVYELLNFGGVLPFSSGNYKLLIPVLNSNSDYIDVELRQKDSTVLNLTAPKVFSGLPQIIESSENLIIQDGSELTSDRGYYLLSNFSTKLPEGNTQIIVKDGELQDTTSFKVVWVEKPHSLYDYEFAIEILKYIEKDSIIRELLSNKEENYYKVLSEYWRKYDRNKSTVFNEVMDEFYSRVDTADYEFTTAGKERGSETDRGRVFIKFGRPEDIERSYVENNQVAELWIYTKLNKRFLFEDKTGLGNYTLIN